jgi:hypothetical protein
MQPWLAMKIARINQAGPAAAVPATPPSRRPRARSQDGFATPSVTPVGNSINNNPASSPSTIVNAAGQSPAPATVPASDVFSRDTTAPALQGPLAESARAEALREESVARTNFIATARNLFPQSFASVAGNSLRPPQASPSAHHAFPRMPETPVSGATPLAPESPWGQFGQFARGDFGNNQHELAVTPNPFFGGPGPYLGPPRVAPPADIVFIPQQATSKSDQHFSVQNVTELTRALVEVKEASHNMVVCDYQAKKLVDDTLAEASLYLDLTIMTNSFPEVPPKLAALLMGAKKKMIVNLLTLQAKPTESASQRVTWAGVIAFLEKNVDTSGYGTPFPIKKDNFRKGKNYGSAFRSSFKDNSGYSNFRRSDSSKGYQPRRPGGSSSSSSSSGQPYRERSRDSYSRSNSSQSRDGQRRGPYDRKDRN